MKQLIITYTLIALILGSSNLKAQDEQQTPTLERGPISGQFDYAIEKSSKYEEFRVVRTAWLYKLKSNALDSLQNLQTQIDNHQAEIDSLKNHIDLLNEEVDNANTEMEKAITAKNSISFLGAKLQKGKYNTIMWGLVIVLALASAFLFMLFKRSHYVTIQMRERYNDLEKEHEAHKKRALEKEKVTARQHLNELNKLKGRE
jgi:tetrahydromethanopterin S-methyltransferase subunit B